MNPALYKQANRPYRQNSLSLSNSEENDFYKNVDLPSAKPSLKPALPTVDKAIFSPRHPRKNFQGSQPDYVHEGEGSDMASVQKIAASKQLTSANLDRWKRTFHAVRAMIRSEADNTKNEQHELEHEKTLKPQATSISQDDSEDENMLEEMVLHESARSWGVISPDSLFRNFWDIIGLLFILIQAITLPFKLAFVVQATTAWAIFEVIIDVFFIGDLVLSFNTGFIKEGVMVLTRKEITFEYLTSWFILDLFASFPYEWIIEGCIGPSCEIQSDDEGSKGAPEVLKLLKLLRFLRIMRLLRVLKMQNRFRRFEEALMSDLLNNIIKFLNLFVNIVFLAHWMACLFYFVGRVESFSNPQSWIVMCHVVDLPTYDKYVTSLYWAITTMITVGYGDIHPYTSNERICVMICMLISCVMFAYIVGSIGNLVSRATEVSERLRTEMININRFLIHRRIPKEMRIKVRRYLEYITDEKKKLQMDESEMMSMLNVPLRDELLIYFHGTILHNCAIFDDFSIDFLSYLTFFLHTEQFSIGDTVFEEEEVGSKMYFIVKGKVLIFTRLPLAVLSELNDDTYFGEIGFFGNKPRTAGAVSMGFTQMLSLSRDGIEKASESFPLVRSRIKEMHNEIKAGIMDSLKLVCYFCKCEGHIAPECPQGDDFITEKNKEYKYELKILRKKIRANKVWDYSTKHTRKIGSTFKDTIGFESAFTTAKPEGLISPNETRAEPEKMAQVWQRKSTLRPFEAKSSPSKFQLKLISGKIDEETLSHNLAEMDDTNNKKEEEEEKSTQKAMLGTIYETPKWNRKVTLKRPRIAFEQEKGVTELDTERKLLPTDCDKK